MEDPSRVIVTASIAGLGVGSLGENATFGYSASKGTPTDSPSALLVTNAFFALFSGCNSPDSQSCCRARPSAHPLQQYRARLLSLEDGIWTDGLARW